MSSRAKAKEKPHYVNNADFSAAVVEYVKSARECEARGEPKPQIGDYVAACFLKIAGGLSHKANFVRYTYREEMMMDAVENCLKAIDNYNLETATRTGKPNAFAYFTQISWYAFLRRIEKEKKQQDIKMKYISETDILDLISAEEADDESIAQTQAYVDSLRERIESVKKSDDIVSDYEKASKYKKRKRKVDSDLTEFLKDDNYDGFYE
jgi:hypothetical protein